MRAETHFVCELCGERFDSSTDCLEHESTMHRAPSPGFYTSGDRLIHVTPTDHSFVDSDLHVRHDMNDSFRFTEVVEISEWEAYKMMSGWSSDRFRSLLASMGIREQGVGGRRRWPSSTASAGTAPTTSWPSPSRWARRGSWARPSSRSAPSRTSPSGRSAAGPATAPTSRRGSTPRGRPAMDAPTASRSRRSRWIPPVSS